MYTYFDGRKTRQFRWQLINSQAESPLSTVFRGRGEEGKQGERTKTETEQSERDREQEGEGLVQRGAT